MGTTGPTRPAAHKRQDTTSAHPTTGTGECAQPRTTVLTNRAAPQGPRRPAPGPTKAAPGFLPAEMNTQTVRDGRIRRA
jgi:hypothetical protein